MKEELGKLTGKEIYIDIQEVKRPETDAQLVAENVAIQLERRIAFRRAMKKAIQTAEEFGAEGIKIKCSGRLGGAEWPGLKCIIRGVFHCILFVPTSTMALPKLRPSMAKSE